VSASAVPASAVVIITAAAAAVPNAAANLRPTFILAPTVVLSQFLPLDYAVSKPVVR
jgi:hypothetical protein